MKSLYKRGIYFVLLLCLLIIMYPFPSAIGGNHMSASGQHYDFTKLFEPLLLPAPDTLSLEYLKSIPLFRCIHHDGFDRLNAIPINTSANKPLTKYSLANENELGKNSFQDTDDFSYCELKSKRVSFSIGIKDSSIAFNHINGKNECVLKCIETNRSDYGFMLQRSSAIDADAKVAFRVIDNNNYYYARLTSTSVYVYKVEKGKRFRLQKQSVGGKSLYGIINDSTLHLYVDFHYIDSINIGTYEKPTQCGLLFCGKEKSEVDDFEVNYLDQFTFIPFDEYIEKGNMNKKQFRSWEAEESLLTFEKVNTNNSKYSIRYQLDYYDDWEEHKIANSRRTELVPKTGRAKSLDTWISCFDIYFPGQECSDEYYGTDALDELFWQSHTPNNINMLSPNVALYLKNDVIRFQALSRRILRCDNKETDTNYKTYNLNGNIARLVDEKSGKSNILEIKRGEWHNFTIFIKEGYSPSHLPRSIVYIDGKKVVDWYIPNAQNCGQPPSYLKLGIYKWPWAKKGIDSNVRRRVLYMDNLQYFR